MYLLCIARFILSASIKVNDQSVDTYLTGAELFENVLPAYLESDAPNARLLASVVPDATLLSCFPFIPHDRCRYG